jgi:glycosyltransferase involved in cell wall biosynthesis
MAPIRVLHNIVSLDMGGIETAVMNLYRHIDKEKVVFDFLVHRPTEGFYEKEIRSYGGKIYRTPRFNPLKMRRYQRSCMEILREHPEYKVFHSHQELNLWTLKYAKKAGIPCRIAHSHNAKTVVNLKFFFFLYEKLFIKRHCTDMFMCSTLAGEWSYGKKAVQDGRVRMSKNGIEVERFRYNEEVRREVRRELNVEDKIVIGHAGRFMQQKNHMFLLDIFRKIHDRNPDTVLLLCGEGRLEEDIRRKVKELELEDHVRFLGVRPDMDRMYQGFDLFLLPSLWEGLPVVGIEAQTSGLPILMSDVITPEVEVTPCVKKLSLKTSPEVWAQTALDMIREHQRQDEYQRIVDAGFDIRETAKWWQNYYLEKYREENEN